LPSLEKGSLGVYSVIVQGVGPWKALKYYSQGRLDVKGVRRTARLGPEVTLRVGQV
jgi:hypothetical protein